MHIKCSLLTFVLTIGFMTAWSQGKKGFDLNGDIKGLKDNSTIYLLNHERDTVLFVKTKGSRFTMKGFVEGGANFFYLGIDTAFDPSLSNALWLVNKPLKITGNVDSLRNLTLLGSAPHDDYMGILVAQEDTNMVKKISNTKEYIYTHSQSLYTPRAIIHTFRSFTPDELNKAYNMLSEEAKDTYWGRELTKRMNSDTSAIAISEGKKMDDFIVTNTDGKKVSILQLVAKSEYTLVDFWASWCSPCRAAIPDLKKTYEQFKGKGFAIIGVSTDVSEQRWRKAMEEDQTPWAHVIDNVQQVSKYRLGLGGIPGYILLDKEGKIVAFNLFSKSTMGKNNLRLPGEIRDLLNELYN